MMSDALVTKANRTTYFQNSVCRTTSRSRNGALPGRSLLSQSITGLTSRLVAFSRRPYRRRT